MVHIVVIVIKYVSNKCVRFRIQTKRERIKASVQNGNDFCSEKKNLPSASGKKKKSTYPVGITQSQTGDNVTASASTIVAENAKRFCLLYNNNKLMSAYIIMSVAATTTDISNYSNECAVYNIIMYAREQTEH